jgi:hypothetical protein
VEVRVRLSTVLGRDRHPGELAGFGPVHAELACHLVEAHTGGRWRYVLTDEDGQLRHTGPLRRRPTGTGHGGRGVVEIQVPAALLAEVAKLPRAELGRWAEVIGEIQTRADLSHGGRREPAGRRPGAVLRRLLEVRHRTCLFPGCRMPARHSDLDHTIDYAAGGPTDEHNLAPACRHDHRVKHHGGWHLRHVGPGHVQWTSRLGHTYPVAPTPVIEPLPDPIPDPAPLPPLWTPDDRQWQHSHILPPAQPRPPPC